MSEYEKFYQKMSELSDERLHEIVSVSFEDYTDVALEAARAVMEERGIQLSLEEESTTPEGILEMNTFSDCVRLADQNGVLLKLSKLFKESDESLEAFKGVLFKLKKMTPAPAEGIEIFVAQIREDVRAGYLFDVFGIESGSEEHFGLEMFPWNEWLSFKIFEKSKGFILKLGLDEFIAICLKKMTSLGMTEEEIEMRISELQEFEDELFQSDDKIEV